MPGQSADYSPEVTRLVDLAGSVLVALLGTAITPTALKLKDLETPAAPLVLKAQGSFVGGEKADQAHVELGGLGPAGHINLNQMYVRYMVCSEATATSRW